MIYISIDPASAKPHAYAVWDSDKDIINRGKDFHHDMLLEFGKIQNVFEFDALLTKYNDRLIQVLIEDQYMQNNVKTLKGLSFGSGKLAGICDLRGIEYEKINVATWTSRSGVYDEINASKEKISAYRKGKLKKLALIASASRFGFVGDEDEASAVLIGYTMKIDIV